MHAADCGLALAYPVDGSRITIDGDLSDWPDGLPRYQAAGHCLAARPVDAEDGSAEFRLGYCEAENALYVALEVQDAAKGEWGQDPFTHWTNDMAIVWLKLPATQVQDAGLLGYFANSDLVPGGRTGSAIVMPSGPWWVNLTPMTSQFQATTSVRGSSWTCEYRINVGVRTEGRHRLRADGTFEFNVSVWLTDRLPGGVQSEGLAWVPVGLAHQRDSRGEVWMLPANAPLGRLAGHVLLSDGEPPGTSKRVRIQAEEPRQTVVHVRTNPSGNFSIALPAGQYRVAVAQRGWETRPHIRVDVRAGETAEVQLSAPPVCGRVVEAKGGRPQPAGRATRSGRWLTYGIAEGLPHASVRTMLQDRAGELWLGTTGGGLVCFDGARFTTYTEEDGLAGNDITHLVEDRDGNLWMTTAAAAARGVTCFARAQNQFMTYNAEDGLAMDIVDAVTLDSEGNVWLATQGAPSRWDSARRQFVYCADPEGMTGAPIEALAGGQGGRVWAGPLNSTRLFGWNGERFVAHQTPVSAFAFGCLLEDRTGGLWVAGPSTQQSRSGNFLFRYDPKRQHWDRYGADRGYGGEEVLAIAEDQQGRIWLGTTCGLLRFSGGRIENLTGVTGLGEEPVQAILEDREGRVWIGVADGGLRCLDAAWTSYTSADGLASDAVTALMTWAGQLTISTKKGLSWLEPQTSAASQRLSGMDARPLGVDRQGRLWVNASRQLSVFCEDGSEVLADVTRLLAYILIRENPTSMVEDAHGNVWTAFSTGGLWRIHRESLCVPTSEQPRFDASDVLAGIWTNHVDLWTIADGLPDNSLTCLALGHAGGVWIGTAHGGASQYDGERFHNYSCGDGLAGESVRAMAWGPAGDLWFATSAGLSRYRSNLQVSDEHGSNDREAQRGLIPPAVAGSWRSFRRGDGLPTDDLRALVVDRHGRVWIGTAGAGVVVYDPELDAFQTISWRNGLSHDTVNALLEDAAGDVWIGTEGGLNRYRPRTNAPAIRITGLTVDGQTIEGSGVVRTRRLSNCPASESDTVRQEPRPTGLAAAALGRPVPGTHGPRIELAGRPKRVTVAFEGVSLGTHPADMVYLCRLSGQDIAELPVYARQVEYTNLTYGSYEFQVRALDRDFNRSAVESLRFVVRPDYAQVSLFGALGCAACVGLVASGLAIKHRRERNHALLERNRSLEETRLSADAARESAESASRAKSLFLANMSHEIRTPMNAILGYSQIMRRDREATPNQRQALETIEKSGRHLLSMINDILDLAKIEAGKMEVHATDFDLANLVQDVAAMCAIRCEEKGLAFRMECRRENEECRKIWVRGDESKLRQVLINLLGNAVKFTEQGGVTLCVENEEGRMQNEEPVPAGGPGPGLLHSAFSLVHFSVTDTGPGIEPGLAARIFQPFQQGAEGVRKGGTGLGLALSRRQVELMGGELEVESQPGKGSRFGFTLRLEAAPSHAGREGRDGLGVGARLKAGCQVSALVVDDNPQNRDVLSRMLGEIGCAVKVAEGGEQALALMTEAVPDVVFLDIRMPGVDGIETARRIRQRWGPDRPILVAVSASVLEHEQAECLRAGFAEFLGKPFQFERIGECLEKLLQVEFERVPSTDAAAPVALEIAVTRLPAELLERARAAAAEDNSTGLKAALRELAGHSEEGRRLAEALQPLVREFDLQRVAATLGRVGLEARRAERGEGKLGTATPG